MPWMSPSLPYSFCLGRPPPHEEAIGYTPDQPPVTTPDVGSSHIAWQIKADVQSMLSLVLYSEETQVFWDTWAHQALGCLGQTQANNELARLLHLR